MTADAPEDRRSGYLKGFAARDLFSSTLSDIVRKSAFVGLGLVLLLGGVAKDNFGTDKVVGLPDRLVFAASVLIIALILDMAQYAYASLAYGIWARLEERRLRKHSRAEPRDGFPSWINIPTSVFFWIKVACTSVAYAILLSHLATQVN